MTRRERIWCSLLSGFPAPQGRPTGASSWNLLGPRLLLLLSDEAAGSVGAVMH